MMQCEVRRKKFAIPSGVSDEPSTRNTTDPSPDAAKLEANGAQHADEGGGMSLKESEGIIAAQAGEVMAFVEDMFCEQEDLLERQNAEQANLLIEILRGVYARKTLFPESLDDWRYRHGRRKVELGKALARNRRFRVTAEGGDHG